MTTLFSSKNGDVNVPAIQDDGSLVVAPADITGATTVGIDALTAVDAAALQQVVAPGSTILSAAATTAIAALTSGSTAAEIVAALQA
ncbi:MAG: hypothetical protein KGL35_24365 [Bradyrhizobium sp.]|nr:hypothetical protein [Bradyrhizobium sp.]